MMYFNNKAVDFTSQSGGVTLILTNQSVFLGLLSLAAKRRAFEIFEMGLAGHNVSLKHRVTLALHIQSKSAHFGQR